jgi:D-cysteine desulfhydrase
MLGHYPTPVSRLDVPTDAEAELWLKDDGVTHPVYGGNKVRKLERILESAAQRGARRVVTVGAAGSHHVLATTLFAPRYGLEVAAVLCPQPWSEHAERNLRSALAAGLEAIPTRSMATVPWAAARVLRRGDAFVPAGGSNLAGTLGYVAAATELVEQIRDGALPEPDVIVTALGSGGTAAGLLAGVLREGLRSRLVGVTVAVASGVARALALALATQALGEPASVPRLARILTVDGRQRGRGYGWPTPAGAHAMQVGARAGVSLDTTYTAKAFAAALGLVTEEPSKLRADPGRCNRPRRVLYWHTLSAAKAPLPVDYKSSGAIDARLFLRG